MRRTTGGFRESGASLPGFVAPLTDHDLAGQLDRLSRLATDRKNENARAALQALSGSDPLLHGLQASVRPGTKMILTRYERDLAAVRQDPRRRLLSAAGIQKQEDELAARRDRDLAEFQAKVMEKLQTITASLAEKLQRLRGATVSDSEMAAAHELANRLRQLTPDLGLGEIIEFVDQIAVGERSRGQLVALLPILESAFRTPNSPWTGRDELRRVVAVSESLCDGGWVADVTAARAERAQRLAGELQHWFFVARTAPEALDQHVTTALNPDDPREAGAFALLPEWPEPDGPAPEEDRRSSLDLNPEPVRRIAAGSVTAEKRSADAAARQAQADA